MQTYLKHSKATNALECDVEPSKGAAAIVGLSNIRDYNSQRDSVNISEPIFRRCYQIRNNSIMCYPRRYDNNGAGTHERNTEKAVQAKKFTGYISEASQKKVTKIILAWLESYYARHRTYIRRRSAVGKRFSFVTLTLPVTQMHTDKELKRLALNRFLIEIERYYGAKDYIWRAEKQKNGNLHFHIMLKKFIPWESLRMLWNDILNDLGYIQCFRKKHGHGNPNSTDVHALKKAKNAAAYITKYMKKDEDELPIDGRVWGCSRNLGKLQYFSDWADEEVNKIVEWYKKSFPEKCYVGEYCEVLRITLADLEGIISTELFCRINEFMRSQWKELSG